MSTFHRLILPQNLFKAFHLKKVDFNPQLLKLDDQNERIPPPQVEMLYGLFQHMAKNNNQNLKRNVDYLIIKEKKRVRAWSGLLEYQSNVMT